MYSTSTAASDLAVFYVAVGVLIGITVTALVTGYAALIGLGFGWRKVKKVTGKKF